MVRDILSARAVLIQCPEDLPEAGVISMLLLAVAALDEAAVQGLYEGTYFGEKAEARVVATGKGAFKVYVRVTALSAIQKTELDGKLEGDGATFSGKSGETGSWSAGTLSGRSGDKAFELKRVQRKPPSLGKKPPEGAVVLVDGKNFDEIVKRKDKEGKEPEWQIGDDGSVQVPKGGMSSKRPFEGGFDLHVEFLCPFMPAARGQGRGNSGCYLPNGDEIQVLDSFGLDTYKGGGCGGLYGYKDPDAFDVFSLASLPPLEWQTYDAEYRVADGKARLTVLHNGVKIHDGVELPKAAKKGGFHFQDHGNPVRYRNIWVLPLP
jgi:hypothetical protein